MLISPRSIGHVRLTRRAVETTSPAIPGFDYDSSGSSRKRGPTGASQVGSFHPAISRLRSRGPDGHRQIHRISGEVAFGERTDFLGAHMATSTFTINLQFLKANMGCFHRNPPLPLLHVCFSGSPRSFLFGPLCTDFSAKSRFPGSL